MPQREKRRLKLARRQWLLAQIAQREARYALASALAEQDRSAGIEQRSRVLLDDYARREAQERELTDGQTLRHHSAFLRSIGAMAENAAQTHRNAADLARRQAGALATAEARLTGHETRLRDAARALAAELERRDLVSELAATPGMARKLQSGGETNSTRFVPGLPVTNPRIQP